MVYQIDSYRHWQQHFGRDDFGYGQFGENLTVDGLADDQVCVGDRYRIGEAEFEVTQPRVTCYRVGLRVGEPELPALLVSHHRPGFYMRVITEGRIQAGRPHRQDQDRPRRADRGRHRRAALPARPRSGHAAPGGADPGAEPRLAAIVPRPAGRPATASARPPRRPPPAWAGFRPLRVSKVVPESAAVSSIYLVAADDSPLPPARPGST